MIQWLIDRWRLFSATSRPIALLQSLLIVAIALPIIALGIGAAILWKDADARARQDLRRRADIAVENSGRVFETHDLILREAVLLTTGLSDNETIASERQFHDRLNAMMAGLPQVLDVLVSGSNGRTLVSAKRYPVPPADISDRDFFQALRDGVSEPYVSSVVTARLENTRVFVVTRRRTGPGGAFGGVVGVAINPAYFEQRYLETGLADPSGDFTMALVRSDGTFLARAPNLPSSKRPPNPAFIAAVQSNAERSAYTATSSLDGVERDMLFQRVTQQPLYIVASVSHAAIAGSFLRALLPHLLFGVPATVGLIALVLLALRRTQQAEVERGARAEAERAVAQVAKLESVGRLAAGIAHDFNNLLAAVIGSMELMRRRLRAGRLDELENLLDKGLLAARRGADLTRRMTTFARPADAPVGPVDPGDIARQVAGLLPSLLGPSIRVALRLEDDIWPVLASSALLEAALMNLVTNARDAMPDGGTITIAGSNVPRQDRAIPSALQRDTDWVRLAVSDTGNGFPEMVKARAFEPFLTTKDVGKGSGLGLAQVHAFASYVGGTACIEEPSDTRGATVAIYIPRTHEAPKEAEVEPPAPAASRPLRVLLVDDDKEVLEFSAMALRDAGHTVIEAYDASAGLEKFAREDFDVLVVDYAMPGATGAAMIREARAMRPDLPVLMISGQAEVLSIDLPSDIDRLAKPFSSDMFVRRIEMAFTQRTEGQQLSMP